MPCILVDCNRHKPTSVADDMRKIHFGLWKIHIGLWKIHIGLWKIHIGLWKIHIGLWKIHVAGVVASIIYVAGSQLFNFFCMYSFLVTAAAQAVGLFVQTKCFFRLTVYPLPSTNIISSTPHVRCY